jgi:hypothetical protein
MIDPATTMDTIPQNDAIKVDHPAVMPNGVYFGLDESRYHAALALSASGIKHMRVSTLDWWARSILNPDREAEDATESFAKILGRAFHRRILEGRAAFQADYAAEIVPEDYPGVLKSNDELKERCVALGLKVGGKKSDLIARILEADPTHVDCIWENIHSDYTAQHPGKTFLPAKIIKSIEVAAAMIEKHPVLSRAFSGGMPEVSCFWTDRETGVPMKARFDYLKPKAIIDLKTVGDEVHLPLKKAFARAIASYKLHLQARLYLDAANEARKLISAGEVHGTVDQKFLDALVMSDDRTFMFVAQRKGIAPLAQGFILPPGLTLDLAKYEIDLAIAAFKNAWQTFGPNVPWIPADEVETYDSTDLPTWIID